MTVFEAPGVTLHHGDCIEVMRTLPDASVDAVVTDPPYGLEFMGKGWDAPWQESDVNADAGFHGGGISATKGLPSFTGSTNPKCLTCKGTRRGRRDGTAKVAVCLCPDGGSFPNVRAIEMRAFQEWCETWATEALRVLKPGGHLLAFGGSRTWHRLAAGIEDAGFEIRDSIAWLYGSGFPKSLDVSKAIDKSRVEDHEPIRVVCRVIRKAMDDRGLRSRDLVQHFDGCHPRLIDHWAARDTDSQPALPTDAQWAVLRDVLAIGDSSVDGEVHRLNNRKGEFGEAFKAREVTGAVEEWTDRTNYALTSRDGLRSDAAIAGTTASEWQGWGTALKPAFEPIVVGRKPLISTVAANVLEHGTGALNIDATRTEGRERTDYGLANAKRTAGAVYGEPNTSADFDSSKGRWPTNVLMEESQAALLSTSYFPTFKYEAKAPGSERPDVDGVMHPTVKPLDLMRWLVRLVTPKGGTILEPFAGSGTTLEAALLEGFNVIGIELTAEYLPLIRARITKPLQPAMFGDWDVTA